MLYAKRVQRVSQQWMDEDERPEGVVVRNIQGEAEVRWDKWPDATLHTWEKYGDLIVVG